MREYGAQDGRFLLWTRWSTPVRSANSAVNSAQSTTFGCRGTAGRTYGKVGNKAAQAHAVPVRVCPLDRGWPASRAAGARPRRGIRPGCPRQMQDGGPRRRLSDSGVAGHVSVCWRDQRIALRERARMGVVHQHSMVVQVELPRQREVVLCEHVSAVEPSRSARAVALCSRVALPACVLSVAATSPGAMLVPAWCRSCPSVQ